MRDFTEAAGWRRLAGAVSAVALVAAACAGAGTQTGGTPMQATPPTASDDQPQTGGCDGSVLVVDARRAPVALASNACASGPPIASGSPWPFSARRAADAMRAFAGLPNVKFEVAGPFDDAVGKRYNLSYYGNVGPGYVGVTGSVDATSGLVLSLTYATKVHDGPGRRAIDAPAAQTKAADYLRQHSVDVAGLSVSSAPTDFGWELTWEKIQGEIGLPPRVTVTVDWLTGDVTAFYRLDLAADPASVPQAKLTRDQAETAAIAGLALTQPKVEASKLRYVDGGYEGLALVWQIYLSGTGDGSDPNATAYFESNINAVTGEPA